MTVAEAAFVSSRGKPRLARCAVLFMDLLGVSEMNRSPQVARHLIALDRVVGRTYRDFLGPEAPWPAAFFSDTLVVAAPLPDADDEAAVVGDLIDQAAWLQLSLVEEGFFARGALSLGSFHTRNGLIFGPALVEAHELESKTAVHPRIVLSPEACACQRDDLRHYSDARHAPQNSRLLTDDDGHSFINYLGPLFEDLDPSPPLRQHRERIVARLGRHRSDRRTWEKYRWAAEYHNHVVRRLADEGLLVAPEVSTWKFSSFG